VADLLEEMEPDEAADLLAELPEKRSRGLLALMEKEESEDVRKLLSYPEDSAGGIMTTEYACVPPRVTAEEAIKFLRQNAADAETLFYVYVTDAQDHLLGVFSLKELIFADPTAPVEAFMEDRVKTVHLLDEQDEIAQVITKYDLLAIPVVDDQTVMHGIVTADDALDKIIPTGIESLMQATICAAARQQNNGSLAILVDRPELLTEHDPVDPWRFDREQENVNVHF